MAIFSLKILSYCMSDDAPNKIISFFLIYRLLPLNIIQRVDSFFFFICIILFCAKIKVIKVGYWRRKHNLKSNYYFGASTLNNNQNFTFCKIITYQSIIDCRLLIYFFSLQKRKKFVKQIKKKLCSKWRPHWPFLDKFTKLGFTHTVKWIWFF